MRAKLIGGPFDGTKVTLQTGPPAPQFLYVWNCQVCRGVHSCAAEDTTIVAPPNAIAYNFLRQGMAFAHYIFPELDPTPWMEAAEKVSELQPA